MRSSSSPPYNVTSVDSVEKSRMSISCFTLKRLVGFVSLVALMVLICLPLTISSSSRPYFSPVLSSSSSSLPPALFGGASNSVSTETSLLNNNIYSAPQSKPRRRVVVFQPDNRPGLDYAFKPKTLAKTYAKQLGYEYYDPIFAAPKGVNPTVSKVYLIRDLIRKLEDGDFMVFLDTDAWINNPIMLSMIIDMMPASILGAFSREPDYSAGETYFYTMVNSGGFVLRIEPRSREMFDRIVEFALVSRWDKWPYDQLFISQYVWEYRERFYVFKMEILNSPGGKVISHDWMKSLTDQRDFTMTHPVFSLKPHLYVHNESAPPKHFGMDHYFKQIVSGGGGVRTGVVCPPCSPSNSSPSMFFRFRDAEKMRAEMFERDFPEGWAVFKKEQPVIDMKYSSEFV